MAAVKSVLGRMGGAVSQFSLAQRTLAIIGVAVLALGGFAVYGWLSTPTMGPLFSGVTPADASAITDQLTADGVTYELADGGTTILVPTDKIYAERIKVAAAGLPAESGGDGYSLLESMPMTSSDFQQKTTYQRALQGELAKTIEAMSGVETASVKLAIPEETVFASTKADPTASVFVRTRAGAELTDDQVQAIVHLVSAGIEGMEPTDVAVVDAGGKVLSAIGTGVTGSSSDQASDYETKVAANLQSLLDQVLGAGKSAVTVTAEVDSSNSETTTETFTQTPDVGPLASSTTNETYTGTGGAGATGVLGPDNIAVPGGDGTTGTGDYSNVTEDVQNAINKTTETTSTPAGAVARQSVAVAVDSTVAAGIDMAQLQTTLAAAAGIDAARGDTLAVQQLPFDTTAAAAAQEALAAADEAAAAEAQKTLITQAAAGGLVLLLVIGFVIAGARRSKKARREALDLGELAARQDAERAALEALDASEVRAIGSGADDEDDPARRRREEISAMADENPAEMAELLRGWLSEPGARR
ncbi:flagellar basal-body MS-ring/collar protein FliF [Cellulomonas marina]|uniref:Flagellar M-ring protein n=1 Tax=Cellulomonas marina TaxID=988821 RepID=A0A1I0WJA9_9CELL|nr:flagellar basal-body MS-ring/collar protein FliF [Cellulomonas marina]GIG27663.1 flagellar M-ring protein [Cellulomonas marina]SFA88220.1 flagellar M-ring protein FliF [Cellulomonas marina]